MSKSYIMQVGVSLMAEYVTQIKSRITIIVGVSAKIRNNIMCAEKDYLWNPATCSWEDGKYLGSTIGDSVITCGETINAAGSVSTIQTFDHITIYNCYYLLSLCKT